MSAGTCRYCGQDILWAISSKKRNMPVDPEPSERGNVLLRERDGKTHAVVYGSLEALQLRAKGQPLHTSHHFTCPKPRRKTRESKGAPLFDPKRI